MDCPWQSSISDHGKCLDPGRPAHISDGEGVTGTGVLDWGGSTLWKYLEMLPEYVPCMCRALVQAPGGEQ